MPEADADEAVVVLDIPNPLSDRDFDDLLEQVNPLSHDEGYGIGLYIHTCTFVTERIQV